MVIKNVSIIAIQEKYLDIITKQIKKIIGDKAEINSVTVKNIHPHTISPNDIVVISSPLIKGLVDQVIPEKCPVVVGHRDINYVNTQKLLNLPSGQQVLVVNDNKSNTDETVESLRETVFEHNYEAYLPAKPIPKDIDYIVTPGEGDILPKGLSNVIDIGPRVLDFNTIEEIINLLQIDYEKSQIVRRYFKACVSLSTHNNDEINKIENTPYAAEYHFKDIISTSKKMNETVRLAKQSADDNSIRHIHIEGAPGTGKSMLAQAIHNHSVNKGLPFHSMNCESTDWDDIETALLSSSRKSRHHDSERYLNFGEKGTICIENIEHLSLTSLKNLFQILGEGLFMSRVITTSSKSYQEFNDEDSRLLRENMLILPTLSERKEDIFPLIENMKQRIQREDMNFTDDVIEFFKEYNWESHVKELYDVITYLSLLEEDPIGINFLPYYLRHNVNEQQFNEIEENHRMISKIEEHGFLGESIAILKTFYEGKKEYLSFGRYALKKRLEEKGLKLSEQQLRARLEVLQELDLTIVRQGRAGTTISHKGEQFIKSFIKNTSDEKEGS